MSAISDKANMIKWVLTLVVPLCFLLVPETPLFTWNIKVFVCITLLGIICFALELLDNMVISLTMVFLYCLTGVASMQEVFSPWTGTAVWMTMGVLITVSVVQKTTIIRRMAYYAAIKTNGNSIRLVLAVMGIALISRILLQGTMACIVIIAIAFGMCESLKLGKSLASAGIILIAAIGYMDSTFFIYSPDHISILYSAASPVIKVVPSYPGYFADNAIFVIGYFLSGLLIALYCRPRTPIGGKEIFERQLKELGALTVAEKKILVIIIGLIIFLFTNQFHHIDMVYGFIFTPMLFYFPGIRVATKQDLKDVSYPVLFFITACMAIGAAGNAVGFGTFVTQSIVPLLEGISETAFLYAVFFISVALNFVMTPLAEMAALGMPLAQICVDLNFSIEAMFYVFCQGVGQLWLPYETSVYLIAFSMGLVYVRDFAKIMTIKFVVNFAFLSLLGILYWKFVGVL